MIFYLSILLFFIVFLVELKILNKQRLSPGFNRDKKSLLFILIGSGVSLVSIFLFPYLGLGKTDLNYNYLGIFIVIGGFVLRQWSIRILGQLFTPVISIQDNHELIIRGPYRYIRHPSYTGLLAEFIGASLVMSNWISFIIVIGFMLVPLLYRIKIEEKELINKFEQKYLNYKETTKALIPWII